MNSRRARSVAHVEYELLRFIGEKMYVDDLLEIMIPQGDEVAKKRFDKGATNISRYLRNMMERRRHKLPKNHEDYKEKGETE
tara:strand:+ start:647 stop:892 length:246 start_codon:yes stop_codon:yes gene_type:complete